MEASRFKLDEAAKAFDERAEESCNLMRILNDDCLLHVLQHMDIYDIKLLSKCCQRLHRIADLEMIHRVRVVPVFLVYANFRIVSKFASEIRRLIVNQRISSFEHVNNLQKLLMRCSNLEKLKLRETAHTTLFSLIDMGHVFSKLKELELDFDYSDFNCARGIIKSAMANCQQLEILQIGGKISNELFEVHYPRLREVWICSSELIISNECMSEFFANNSHISKLTLLISNASITIMDFSALEALTHLQELRIKTDAHRIVHPNFKKMPALKVVSLTYYCNRELPNMKSLNHADLDELHIAMEIPNAPGHHFRAFPKQITSFKIHNKQYGETWSFLDIIDFVRERPKLYKLEMPNFVSFLRERNEVYIVILPEVMTKLVSHRVTSSPTNCNYINHEKLHLESSKFYYTHWNEIADLAEPKAGQLPLLTRFFVPPERRSITSADHAGMGTYLRANCSNESETYPQKQRIVLLRSGLTWYPLRF